MSLLEKASIITTPTAQSEGKLHSIKGGSVADFDVVRGSAATRVNAEGLIEDISVIGGEEITNGDFSNGSTDWDLGDGWSIGEDKVIVTSTINQQLKQTLTTTIGKSYKVSLEILDITEGSIRIYLRDGGTAYFVGGTYASSGVYDFYFTSTETLNTFAVYPYGTTTASITNISVKEVIDATNIPRIDYSTGEGVILTEPQSTNLIEYSEDFSNASWLNSNSTDTSNYGISPSGLNNSTRFLTTANIASFLYINSLPILDATNYTLSFWVKSNSNSLDKFRLYTTTGNTSSEFTSTNKWARYEYSFLSTGTTTNIGLRGVFGQETDVQVWGAQLEALPYATSYIPTNGAIATRLADSVTGAGDATTFNSTEGVLYAEMATNWQDVSGVKGISLKADANNYIAIYFRNSNFLSARIVGGGNVTQLDTTYSINTFYKVAVLYTSTSAKLYVNGSLLDTDTTNTLPMGLNELGFNRGGIGIGTDFEGEVKSVITFDTALSDEELTCLTTI